MKVLALDTSSLSASVGLIIGSEEKASYLPAGETHSRTLLPEIERLLTSSGLTVRDLDLVAAGLGPGSFTGLRIGLSAAKALAWAAKKPLVGVPTLDVMADSLSGGDSDRPVCAVIDARKGQVYAAVYHPANKGGLRRRTDYLALAPEDLTHMIERETWFVGEGARTWERVLRDKLGTRFCLAPEEFDRPRPALMAGLALDLLAGGAPTDPALIKPLYIRPPDIRPPRPRTI